MTFNAVDFKWPQRVKEDSFNYREPFIAQKNGPIIILMVLLKFTEKDSEKKENYYKWQSTNRKLNAS